MNGVPRCRVSELVPALQVDQTFLISQPQLRTTSRGDYYIAAFLSDKTGRINGRMWQATEAIFKSLPGEGFVHVKGRTENYQNSLQLVIDAMWPVDAEEVDFQEFVPSTDRDIEEMFTRMREILAAVKNEHLRGLLELFFDDTELMAAMKKSPAAIVLHHAYLGGLLEHTLGMLELATRILPLYPELDSDLTLTALFLHDIGKTKELACSVSFKYSDQGQLIGHIVKGTLLIQEKVEALNKSSEQEFPQVLLDCLMHIIVSHHGQREFGCPVLPATPEAFFVHYLDNLDSKLALCRAEMKADTGDSNWTNYIRAIETRLFKQG